MAEFPHTDHWAVGQCKELIARAVGLSRYLPVDPKTGVFAGDFAGGFSRFFWRRSVQL